MPCIRISFLKRHMPSTVRVRVRYRLLSGIGLDFLSQKAYAQQHDATSEHDDHYYQGQGVFHDPFIQVLRTGYFKVRIYLYQGVPSRVVARLIVARL